MAIASRYWRIVRLDGTGNRRIEEVAIAKQFFLQQFSDLVYQPDVPDRPIQQQLIQIIWKNTPQSNEDRDRAERCLRCYISHHIEQSCVYLETQFGFNHGFNRYDLFPMVLDDDGQPKLHLQTNRQYRSLATEILQTFDPTQASLSAWTSRLVRQHEELNRFLREQGVFLISDWALLNSTQPRQLQRILSEFHALTAVEIEQACQLLQAYHAVYRADRLQQRQAKQLKGKLVCPAPTPDQLSRIAQMLGTKRLTSLSHEKLMRQLQDIATHLRQYRVHQQGGNSLVTDSLDRPETQARAVELPAPEADADQDAQTEFLQAYRQTFSLSLDQAIAKATCDRVAYLKRKSEQTAQNFLKALQLFHCQGKSMSEIASYVGLEAQFQVTRLMKLKEFRATVQQYLLQGLLEHVLEKAKVYADPNRLHNFNQQIEIALDEQVSTLLGQAEAEAAVAKRQPLTSLFSRRLCLYLDTQFDSSTVS